MASFPALLRDKLDFPLNFTVADGTGIEKGTLLKLTDPRTAIAASARGDAIAGIAHKEKVASDGKVSLAVYRRGVFDMLLSGTCSAGDMLEAEGNDDQVIKAQVTPSGGKLCGQAFEDGTDGETIQVYFDVAGLQTMA